MFEINGEQNFFLTASETLGDLAAPVNRTKGPGSAGDQGGSLMEIKLYKRA